jgi:hypothetical protein
MEKLNISQGDSVTIAVVLPADKMAQVEDVVVYLGNKIVAKKSDNTLIATVTANVFNVRLSSALTQSLSGQYNLVVAVDYADLGVKKVSIDDSLLLVVEANNNQFNNESVSTAVSATITIAIVDNNLIQNVTLATIYRGYNNLELYRIEKNLPTATFDQMMFFYAKKVSVAITSLGDGATITHNLGGRVLTRFVDANGEILNNVRTEYLNDNAVTLRTPLLDDIMNQTYTGKMICEIY